VEMKHDCYSIAKCLKMNCVVISLVNVFIGLIVTFRLWLAVISILVHLGKAKSHRWAMFSFEC
jgi:hypothetical protein